MERIKEALERARRERTQSHSDGAAPRVDRVQSVEPATPTGVIRYTQTRVVPVDPAHLAKHRVIISDADRSPAGDAFRMLRTRVLQSMRSHRWNSLAVTSPGEGDGKSVTALNLAISLAREVNHTVLLVDLDLRRPTQHRLLGIDVEQGLTDYMLGDMPLSKVLVNPSVDRLVVLPGREGQENASELLTSPRMHQLVDDITHRYPERLVIFDLPPVCMSDDVIAFSPLVGAFLLVVREGGTHQPQLRHAAELLRDVNLIGTVLTMAKGAETAYL